MVCVMMTFYQVLRYEIFHGHSVTRYLCLLAAQKYKICDGEQSTHITYQGRFTTSYV